MLGKRKEKEKAKKNYSEGKKLFEQGKTKKALQPLSDALAYFQTNQEAPILADIYRMLGQIFFDQGKLIESRHHYKHAFQAYKNFNNKIGMADSYDQIAVSFLLQDEFTHALDYQEKALEIRKTTPDKRGIVRGMKNLAIITYQKRVNPQAAFEILQEALILAKKIKAPQLITNISLAQSKMLKKMEKYEKALTAIIIAQRFSEKYSINLPDDFEETKTDLFIDLGFYYYDTHQFNKAKKFLKKAANNLRKEKSPLLEEIEQTIRKLTKKIND